VRTHEYAAGFAAALRHPASLFRLQETKMVFEKLYKFIGKDIKSMIERPDGRYCLRLHKNRVYYVSERIMKKATNVRCRGKFPLARSTLHTYVY
jgi:UPF0113 Pre-PUA domain